MMNQQSLFKWRGGLAAAFGLVTWFVASPGWAQAYLPGNTYYGRSNYIEYIAGELPITISAPHGGALTPSEIPNRTYGVTGADLNTAQLARNIRSRCYERFGFAPHVVINNLHRSKLDANREIVEAAQGNEHAEMAWHEFHDFIGYACTNVTERHGRGFYIDLHGHTHPIARLELGWLLSPSELNQSDAVLNGSSNYPETSSILTLANESPLPFATLLRGSNSFGALIAGEGYPAVPSPDMPSPGTNAYYDGGYNTARYNSGIGGTVDGLHFSGGTIDGLQIECNYTGVRDTLESRTAFAESLARVMEQFFAAHYGVSLRESVPKAWITGGGGFSAATNWFNGALPVSTNHLWFTGPGGGLNHDLPALATGSGVVGSITFSNAPTGSYTFSGNAFTVLRGITNNSSVTQTINNAITLAGPQTFASDSGALALGGSVNTSGHPLGWAGRIILNGTVSGPGAVNLAGSGVIEGNGTIAGAVSGSGTVAPGTGAGTLALGGGLDLSAGGTYRWELAVHSTSNPGVDYDVISLTGGNLVLGGTSVLALVFTNAATAPDSGNAFWQAPHAWTIVGLSGSAANPGATRFASIQNNTYAAGSFTNYADGGGNVVLEYIPVASATPPQITGVSKLGDGNFSLTLSGALGQPYSVRASTNLALWWPDWTILGAGTFGASPVTFTDFNATNFPQRFYLISSP